MLRSPKLTPTPSRGSSYQYYAGFSEAFVEDALRAIGTSAEDDLLLDPWNGAGTTTAVAQRLAVNAVGFDINPVAVVIARARLLEVNVVDSLVPLAAQLSHEARIASRPSVVHDPLRNWFGVTTAQTLRSIEAVTRRSLVSQPTRVQPGTAYTPYYLPHSSLASFYYVALFRTVRQLVRRCVPTNPTWVKRPVGKKIGVPSDVIHATFLECIVEMAQRLAPESSSSITVSLSSSSDLPLADGSVDAVVASPPYCTRLDYVKATSPELAVLGVTEEQARRLRDSMIGTPTITKTPSRTDAFGSEVADLLKLIAEHESYASSTYYKRYFEQYFTSLGTSLEELRRVVKPGSPVVLVVQDSYHKDIHVDLPQLVGKMADAGGWSNWSRMDFVVPRTMASLHPGRVRRSGSKTVESAVTLVR